MKTKMLSLITLLVLSITSGFAQTEKKEKGIFWIPFSELDYRVDAGYYFNKFLIEEHFEGLRERGHHLVALSELLVDSEPVAVFDGEYTCDTSQE